MSILYALTLLVAQAEPMPAVRMGNPDGTASTIDLVVSANRAKIDEAALLIKSGKPTDAIAVLDGIIADAEKQYAGETRLVFAARFPPEALMYAMMGATQKKEAIVIDETWPTAHFLKGFALIDLRRADEAKPHFDKAIVLSPANPQFLAERGEWFKNREDWASAYADFESALGGAGLSPDEELNKAEKGRALRGMAFVRIEQGNLKEAEKLLRQALKLNPSDAKAKNELTYIKDLKAN
jgi:tetratricopeptide (TPR) repeat protein